MAPSPLLGLPPVIKSVQFVVVTAIRCIHLNVNRRQ